MTENSSESTVKQRKPPLPLPDSLDEFNKLFDDKQQQTSIEIHSKTNKDSTLTLENFCWFIASIACVYFTDICNVILYNQNVHRNLMLIAFCLIGFNLLIASYLIIYVTYIKKVSTNKWNEMYPALIPIATGSFIAGSIL
jgi:hypothetical protein